MNERILALVAALGTVACGSLRGRADDALAQRRYLDATRLYDEILASDSANAEAAAARQQARAGALQTLLDDAIRARLARRTIDAANVLADLLTLQDRWSIASTAKIQAELAATVDALASETASRTRSAGPLAGEAFLVRGRALLARHELAARRTELVDRVRRAGAERCASLAGAATTPYARWTVDRYCRHFGARGVEIGVLPNLAGALVIEGDAAGADGPFNANLRTALADAFRASVWYADGAPATRAVIEGSVDASFDAEPTTITREWTEQVPFTILAPDLVASTQTYSVSTSAPTRGNPYATRSSTATRTTHSLELVPFVGKREEERSLTIGAIKRTGHYTCDLHVKLEAPAVTASVVGHFSDSGIDHEVTYEPGDIEPEHANLITSEAFGERTRALLVERFARKLDAEYTAQFCRAASYTVEEAATCAYFAADRAPAPVHDALRTLFGAEEPLLAPVLARRPVSH